MPFFHLFSAPVPAAAEADAPVVEVPSVTTEDSDEETEELEGALEGKFDEMGLQRCIAINRESHYTNLLKMM
jgi:hypothetical protein